MTAQFTSTGSLQISLIAHDDDDSRYCHEHSQAAVEILNDPSSLDEPHEEVFLFIQAAAFAPVIVIDIDVTGDTTPSLTKVTVDQPTPTATALSTPTASALSAPHGSSPGLTPSFLALALTWLLVLLAF